MTGKLPIAVVTGGARGIGRAIVARLARDGFEVVSADLEGDMAENEAAAQRDDGFKVTAAVLDICRRDAVVRLFDSLPRLDVLVNNAGIFWERAFMDLDEDDFRRVMEVNVIGTFVVAQEGARRMEPGGRIVNIASRSYLGEAGDAHYVASKAAVVGLTRAMALDLRQRGIIVNAVAPGMVDTPMLQSLPGTRLEKARARRPSGKLADPDVVANAVAFLASPLTLNINGQTLSVDGGDSIGMLSY